MWENKKGNVPPFGLSPIWGLTGRFGGESVSFNKRCQKEREEKRRWRWGGEREFTCPLISGEKGFSLDSILKRDYFGEVKILKKKWAAIRCS